MDEVPNLFWAEGQDKGYLVLDLDASEYHADFFGTSFADGDIGRAERPAQEQVHATFRGTPGDHHLEVSDGPAN